MPRRCFIERNIATWAELRKTHEPGGKGAAFGPGKGEVEEGERGGEEQVVG